MRFIKRAFSVYSGFPRSIYAIFVATVVNGIGMFVFPFLAFFLTRRLLWSAGDSGAFIALSTLMYIPGMLIGGPLADKIGRKKVMLGAQALCGAFFIPCGFLGDSQLIPWLLLASVFFDGITDPARSAMQADLTTPGNRQAVFSFIYLGHNLGFACGPLIAGFLFESAPQWIFWGNAMAIGCAISIMLFNVPETKPDSATIAASAGSGAADAAHEGGIISALLSRPGLLVYSFLCILYSFVYAQHRFALPLQTVATFGSSGSSLFGGLMTLNAVMVILFTMPVVALTKRWKPIMNVAIAGLFYAVGFGIIGFPGSPLLFYISASIWSLGEIFQATSDNTYVMNHTPMSHRGRFQAILPLIAGSGFSIGPFAAGRIIDGAGLAAIWPLLAIVALAGSGGIALLGLTEKLKTKRPSGSCAR